jgi:hypothetical protein
MAALEYLDQHICSPPLDVPVSSAPQSSATKQPAITIHPAASAMISSQLWQRRRALSTLGR